MKSQGWIRDIIVSVVGGVLILVAAEMRADFRSLVISVNSLSADVRVLAAEVTTERDTVKDHEQRIRDIENDYNSAHLPHKQPSTR